MMLFLAEFDSSGDQNEQLDDNTSDKLFAVKIPKAMVCDASCSLMMVKYMGIDCSVMP
jgi:hypothetical protein